MNAMTKLTAVEMAEIKLKRANIALMRHAETRMFAPFIGSGKWHVEEDAAKCPTAYTDGENCVYGLDFIKDKPDAQLRFLVMHEKGHEFLMHMIRRTPEMKANHRLFNLAADYVINGMIMRFQDKQLCEMIPGGLYDAKYHGWSVVQVFNDLKKDEKNGGSKGKQQALDEHGTAPTDAMTPEERADKEKDVKEDLRQGAMMAGKVSKGVPQAVEDALAPEVDWKKEMQDFLSEACHGRDDMTWRRYNKRRIMDEVYLPSTESETLGEVVIAIDGSGSTCGVVLAEFVDAVQLFCEQTKPSLLRVLWWDTNVHAEQVFDGDYTGIKRMLTPHGGGGTRAGCVSDYLIEKNINPVAVVVFTDGYTESNIEWRVLAPTLWMVTQRRDFTPPTGRVVKIG